jgi:Protein ChrB, N-terminal
VGDRVRWVFLAYRLPREPSTPRITLWRKLRRLGAVQMVDNLVALPLDARTREQFEWLADEVLEADGEASIWMAETATAAQEREIASRMAAAVAEEYRRLIDAAAEEAAQPEGPRPRTLGRLRRDLRLIRARDFFPPPEAEQARRAVDLLATTAEPVR